MRHRSDDTEEQALRIDRKVSVWTIVATMAPFVIPTAVAMVGTYYSVQSMQEAIERIELRFDKAGAKRDAQLERIQGDIKQTNDLLVQRAIDSAEIKANLNGVERRLGVVEQQLREGRR